MRSWYSCHFIRQTVDGTVESKSYLLRYVQKNIRKIEREMLWEIWQEFK